MYDKFRKIIDDRGITPYKVSKDTGISQSCLSEWKKRKSTPRVEKLQKIASYLNVSIEELLVTEEE